MDERALRRRLFLGVVCFLFLTAYFILGAQHRTFHTTLPAVVFSRTDHSQYWTGSLAIRGSLTLKIQNSDRSFSGKLSIPGYPETSEQQFTGSMLLHQGADAAYEGWLIYFQEEGSDTGDTFILGKVFTTKKLRAFSMALTAPGAMQPPGPGSTYHLDYILIAPCTSLEEAVAVAERQGLLAP